MAEKDGPNYSNELIFLSLMFESRPFHFSSSGEWSGPPLPPALKIILTLWPD